MIKLTDEELFKLQLVCPHKFKRYIEMWNYSVPYKYIETSCEYCKRILGYEAMMYECQDMVDNMNMGLQRKYEILEGREKQ
jgi:hypothetical protein